MTRPTRQSISLALTGAGGAGVVTTGQMLLEAAGDSGWYGHMRRSYGPQIRGGESAAMIRLSTQPIAGPGDSFDLLVALDWKNVDRFIQEISLDDSSVVLFDPATGSVPESITATGARLIELPLAELSRSSSGARPNMVALGLLAGLLGIPEDNVSEIAERMLARKGSEVVTAARASITIGFDAREKYAVELGLEAPAASAGTRWNMSGNEATGLGALRGGVRLVAAYPITPASDLLEWLAPRLEQLGGTLIQAEDELASINMIVGGSFGGVPTLTGTSGPGFALMVEGLGLAVATETPIVVVNVMRGGPSTGIPTKSEQADLNIALYGIHGDSPHLVLAPISIGDCVATTQWAVELAETLQAPVIVLTDQAMAQARAIIDKPELEPVKSGRLRRMTDSPDLPYQRFALTPDGISPMVLPGTAEAVYTADGLEHNERGTPSTSALDHAAQLEKRQRKVDDHDYGAGSIYLDDQNEAELAVLTWGSSTGGALEAVARARAAGHEVRLIAPRLLLPAQTERMSAALDGVTRLLVVEQSHSGQFYRYLRAHYELPGEQRVLARPGPLPIRPGEIYQALLEWS